MRRDTGVDFVTIMSPTGIRWTHPDPAQIGEPSSATPRRALAGETFTETYTGTLGASVRAVDPGARRRRPGRGLVSAGITVDRISPGCAGSSPASCSSSRSALAVGGAGTYLVTARLRRQTHGMDAGAS